MFDHESRISKEQITTDKYPPWMKGMLLDIRCEEIFQQGKDEGLLRGELRAARKMLWLLLTHRFEYVPSAVYNYIDWIGDSERLLAAFRQALTIEKIEDLRI
jgi:hypothetical protein